MEKEQLKLMLDKLLHKEDRELDLDDAIVKFFDDDKYDVISSQDIPVVSVLFEYYLGIDNIQEFDDDAETYVCKD